MKTKQILVTDFADNLQCGLADAGKAIATVLRSTGTVLEDCKPYQVEWHDSNTASGKVAYLFAPSDLLVSVDTHNLFGGSEKLPALAAGGVVTLIAMGLLLERGADNEEVYDNYYAIQNLLYSIHFADYGQAIFNLID